MNKKAWMRWFVAWTDGWNKELHEAIEAKVMGGYREMFPEGLSDLDEQERVIKDMRTFYYDRMMTTATLLVAGISVLVSSVALIVSVIALLR